MAIKSLSSSSLTNNVFYRSLLAGSDPFIPFTAADDLLEVITLSSDASSVTFSGLGAYTDYQHLQIRLVGRSAEGTGGARDLYIRLNGDTGNNYAWHYLTGNGSSVFASAGTSTNTIAGRPTFPRDGNPAGEFGAAVVDLLDASSTSKNTTVRFLSGVVSGEDSIALSSGLFVDTSAITSIQLYQNIGDLATGSRASLYGIKGA